MIAYTARTIRGIVNYANENKIQREDIISLLKQDGDYVLIYYK